MRMPVIVGIGCIALVITACSAGADPEVVASLQAENQRIGEERAALESTVEDLRGQLESAQGSLAAAQDSIDDVLDQRDAAEAERDAALSEAEQLRLAYDPEIQRALDEAVAQALPAACSQGREDARAGERRATGSIDVGVDLPAGVSEAAFSARLDRQAIADEYERCYEEETDLIAERRQQRQLTRSKGSGFYTVGDEIAPGTWRSTGGGDSCYWERLRGLSGEFDDIITNYYGNAGVTVTISSSDAAFSSTGCGMWEYLG